MTDKPRRPVLSLKNPPAPKPVTPAPAPTPPLAPARSAFRKDPAPAPVTHAWRCKPCGTGFDVPASLADDESMRCPSCNARVGLARDFRSDPPNLAKVRARQT